MTREWQIKIGDDAIAYAGDLGIEQIDIAYASLATDVATLRCRPDLAIAYDTMVGIYYAGTRRFLGRVVRPPTTATGTEAFRTIRLAGPWEWLERIPYRQAWRLWQDDELGTVMQSRVILHQDADGDPVSVEAQLADVVGYAASRGAPIAFGLAAVSLTLPFDEQRDIRCSYAIARCLRYAPDVCSRIDYAVDPPMIYFGAATARTIPASADKIVTGYRDDLVVPGIIIEIERIATVSTDGGQRSYRTLSYLSAGTIDAVDTLHATLQLAGPDSSRSSTRIDVETEDIPDPLTNAAWWIARHPRLQGILAADLVFIQAVRHLASTNAVVTDAVDYPRISLNPLADLTALDVHARTEVFRATVDIVKRDDAGEIIDAEHAVELALELVTTDATTREYRVPQASSSTDGEPVPANLATELLAHYSVRYAEGMARWPARVLWVYPGDTIDGTPIQTVAVSSADKAIEVVFGPPQHLSISDFASLLQGFRTRRASVSWQARVDGEPAAESELAAGQTAIAKAAGHAPGAKRHLTVTAAAGAGGAIRMDPTLLEDDDVMQPRPVAVAGTQTVYVFSTGSLSLFPFGNQYNFGIEITGAVVTITASVAKRGSRPYKVATDTVTITADGDWIAIVMTPGTTPGSDTFAYARYPDADPPAGDHDGKEVALLHQFNFADGKATWRFSTMFDGRFGAMGH